jgi:ribosomal protein S18 acetylase RimI-like enzyme
MNTVTIDIRKAEPRDAQAIADVHHQAWHGAYAGIIPYRALNTMINRRGSQWWANAIRRSATVLVVEIGGKIAGYTTVGRNRARELPQQGEIYELYLRPEYQGVGLGSRLFAAAKQKLADHGLKGMVVWALEDNTNALKKVAFVWD